MFGTSQQILRLRQVGQVPDLPSGNLRHTLSRPPILAPVRSRVGPRPALRECLYLRSSGTLTVREGTIPGFLQ
jgi:hypothetical protein